MTAIPAALHALDRAKDAYEADGYTVRLDERLPPPFQAFVADAVAERGDELVVVEVRSADMHDQSRNRLARLAEIIKADAGWRLDIVTYEPETLPPAADRTDIVRRVDEARRVAAISPDAAVMLTWSAIEGALHRLSQQRGRAPTRIGSPRTLVRDLAIDGVLSDNQAAELDKLARLRDEIAHGLRAEHPDPDRLDWFQRFALAAADNDLATIDDMIDWFRAHHASPENAALVHDNEDGEHVRLDSGFRDAADVLRDRFETALEADLTEATEILERGDPERQAVSF